MTLPEASRPGIEAALASRFGRPAPVVREDPVGGGCISPSVRLETESGDVAFLKRSGGAEPPGFFAAEALSLRRLAEAGAARVPAVLGVADDWLLLEWLEPGTPGPGAWAELGRALARLHRHGAEAYGWEQDNWIGTLPQRNRRTADWPSFWRDERLAPQLESAYDCGFFGPQDRRRFDRLLERLAEVVGAASQEDGPSLLHGDLWSGNVHFLADGLPALVDPSTYYGHREVDLAMSRLFGGFGHAFYDAYVGEWAPVPGHRQRLPIYQLYYLLVHVNLFGEGYVGSTRSALARAGL